MVRDLFYRKGNYIFTPKLKAAKLKLPGLILTTLKPVSSCYVLPSAPMIPNDNFRIVLTFPGITFLTKEIEIVEPPNAVCQLQA